MRTGPAALLRRRPPSLAFCRCPLFLCGEAAAVRAPRGFGRPAGSSFRGKAGSHELGQLRQRDLAIAQLGPLLRCGHGHHPADEAPSSEPFEQQHALVVRERCRGGDVPGEFNAAVRSVDVLASRPGGTREPPAEFGRGNRERGRHLKVHATSVAHDAGDRGLTPRAGTGWVGPRRQRFPALSGGRRLSCLAWKSK